MDSAIQNDLPYNSLSPVSNADSNGHYSATLLWALQNRREKDIKNIALTGPYGSGKSSILKTFEANNTDSDLVFLNISLATFKEELHDKKEPTPEAKQTMLRLIELSILQQIFYHEKDEDIPDTRFKKTRRFSDESAKKLTMGIFFFGVALMYLLYSEQFWSIFGTRPVKCLLIAFQLLALGTILYSTYLFISKSIRPLRSLQLKKFNVQDAEFAVDESISKSILNEHLDEILYFFEVTDYTVVIIEDLDRFQQTEIFTKLRELNHLINYSKKIERHVTFVYAVRDEMFTDKDRTKFFDFIIPVIPVINSSNSNEKLLDIVRTNGYAIKTDLLDDISLFVDDMRLLYNIMNEYYLYHIQLTVKDQNKLLAMIVYKNIYPNDFVELSNGSGELHKALHDKNTYVKTLSTEVENDIKALKEEIKEAQALALKDANELRKLYVLEYLSRFPNAVSFAAGSSTYPFVNAMDETTFQYFIDNKMQYNILDRFGDIIPKTMSVKFAEIQKSVDSKHSYTDRLKIVSDAEKDNLEALRQAITEKEFHKNELKNRSIKDLMVNDLVKLEFKDQKQQQLVSILLRAGYIDENYLDYVSIFYEGSITRPDREFLLNVKAHIYLDFDYKLGKVDKLISKIPQIEFEHDYVLNYDLVEFLMTTSYSGNVRSKVLRTLSNESERSFSFIESFIDRTTHVDKFFKYLTKHWTGMWRYISRSTITDQRKDFYLALLLQCGAEIEDLAKIASVSTLKTDLEERSNLLTILPNTEKSKRFLETLDVKFGVLDLQVGHREMVEFIIKTNLYQINITMIKQIMKYKGSLDEKLFGMMNYGTIKIHAPKELVSYIEANMESYLDEVWFALPDNKHEEEKHFAELINNKDISNSYKIGIIKQTVTKITDLVNISNHDMDRELMKANKVTPRWDNILYYLEENEDKFDETLTSFVSDIENANRLATFPLNINDHPKGKPAIQKLGKTIIMENSIENAAYSRLLDGIPYSYNNLNFVTELDTEKVEALIDKEKFSVTPENFSYLQENFDGLAFKLAEKRPVFVSSNIDKFSFDPSEVIATLESDKFTLEQKDKILGTLDPAVIISKSLMLKRIGHIIFEGGKLVISTNIKKAVLKCPLVSLDIKVNLYIKWASDFPSRDFFEIVGTWGEGFSDIQRNGKQAVIKDTAQNWVFASLVQGKGFISTPKTDKKGIRIYNRKQN